MIGKKLMMWIGAGVLSAAMIPAVSEARNLAAHKRASSPTALVSTTASKKTVKLTTTGKKATRLHSTHKATMLTHHRTSHVSLATKTTHTKLTSKTTHAKLTSKPATATKLHSHVKPTAAPVPVM